MFIVHVDSSKTSSLWHYYINIRPINLKNKELREIQNQTVKEKLKRIIQNEEITKLLNITWTLFIPNIFFLTNITNQFWKSPVKKYLRSGSSNIFQMGV